MGAELRAASDFLAATVQPGDRIVAAVSGGADSMALLDLLLRHRERLGYSVVVGHVHHHLRAASDEEWRFVEAWCAARGVAFYGGHVDVAALCAEKGLSLEAAAHQLRHEALRAIVRECDAQWLALAHQANDRAETVLMNILRGSAGGGLAAMPQRDGCILRPLLACDRPAIEAYCQARDLPYVSDESNADTTILRNRLRHELLPQLGDYNPQIVAALNRLAESCERDQNYLRAQAEALLAEAAVFEAAGWCLFERAPVAAAHEAVQAALIRLLVQRFAKGRGNLRSDMVAQMIAILHKGQGRYDLGQGLIGEATRRWCYIGPQPAGEWREAAGIWRQDFLDAALTLPEEWAVREAAAGDVIALPNLGRKRLKKIFQEQGLPPCLRPVWPVVYDTKIKEIIWLPFLAQSRQLMYYKSVTLLKVKPMISIAQREARLDFAHDKQIG